MGIYIKGFNDFSGKCYDCYFRGLAECLLTGDYIGIDADYEDVECPCVIIPENAEVAMTADGLKMVYIPITEVEG